MSDFNKDKEGIKTYRGTFWGLLILLTLACISHPFIIRWAYSLCSSSDHLEQCGQIGDCFGALNAFISGCAFIAVVVSLKQQTEQLKLQREDLNNQRDELALQREEMKASRQEAERQTEQFKAQVEIGKNAQDEDNFYRRIELAQVLSNCVMYYNSQKGITVQKGITGILAWQNIYLEMYETFTKKSPISSEQVALLSGILAWHRTLVTLMDDIIEQSSHAHTNLNVSKQRIKIIFNSLNEYQRDFLILLLDVHNNSICAKVKDYLYKEKHIDNNVKLNLLFSAESPNKAYIIQELRSFFPS